MLNRDTKVCSRARLCSKQGCAPSKAVVRGGEVVGDSHCQSPQVAHWRHEVMARVQASPSAAKESKNTAWAVALGGQLMDQSASETWQPEGWICALVLQYTCMLRYTCCRAEMLADVCNSVTQ